VPPERFGNHRNNDKVMIRGIFLVPILRENVGISGILVLMVMLLQMLSLLAWFVTVLLSLHPPRGTGTVAATPTPS
jgi:hypothetical protein